MVSEKVVETREFAHKVVEAAAGSGELAQREPGERARRHRPQQEGHVREVAAFGEDADKVSHYFCCGSGCRRSANCGDHKCPYAAIDGAIAEPARQGFSGLRCSLFHSSAAASLDLISQGGALTVGDRRIASRWRLASGIDGVH